MKIIGISAILGVLLFIGSGVRFFSWVNHEMAKMRSDDPEIWQNEIVHLTQKNRSLKNDSSAVLFVGSSSFRFWDHIEEDLSPFKVINNGFGGAKLPDVLHYQDELIFDYRPKKIVFFLGSNDISGNSNDITPGELYKHYETLALTIHQKLPDCHMYILAITPTLARWNVWPDVKKANEIIRYHSGNAPWVTFIDVEDEFLDKDGEPIWKYYKWDGTHLSRAGYRIWSEALKDELSDNLLTTK